MVDELLEILAHGDNVAVMARIYDVEHLSETERQIPLGLLRKLRAPAPGWRLQLVDRQQSGRFELLVLRIPWLVLANQRASGFHPLIVSPQNGAVRAVGFILPWNEVMPRLVAEMDSIGPLSLAWIRTISALQAPESN